ncbi:MAG: ATP-dependent Clp protease proteolytic subunit [Deltaproteobacteria bacterium]|nr:ATP-dependent Clp protease proteolytic subunit [Deltaproteobacteria bacterium]
MKTLFAILLSCIAFPAAALELGPRRIEVSGQLDTKAGVKLATDLVRLSADSDAPIYLLVTASGGSAQGVMAVADAIKAIEAPVVAVVLSPVQGAGAALPLFTDRVVMLPSAQLVLTEVDYEGVAKPPEPKVDTAPADPTKPAPKEKEPTKQETFLQKVRADYLGRFWSAVAKRMGEKGNLQDEIEKSGGRVVTAQEALGKKIAFEVVDSIQTPKTVIERTELKVTTSRTQAKTTVMKARPVN